MEWVSIGKRDKWPKALSFLREVRHLIIDNKGLHPTSTIVNARRFMLTLSKINRIKSDFKEINIANLKQKFNLNPKFVAEFERFARLKLADVADNVLLTELNFNPFFGPSNGPNAVNKVDSMDAEAFKILNDPTCKQIADAIRHLSEMTNNMSFFNYMESRSQAYQDWCLDNNRKADFSKIILRKITAVTDTGNKSRTIAIVDWWTQSLLDSFEFKTKAITYIIYRDHCDYWSHSDGWESIIAYPFQENLRSIDAVEWTDNLPASLQYIVFKILYGQKAAKSWYDLAVKCPWEVGNTGQTIKYGKGQAMGTKQSFVIAQLTQLLIIDNELSTNYQTESPFFREVGDDIVVDDPEGFIAKAMEQIGVPINVSKSKRATALGNFVEYVS